MSEPFLGEIMIFAITFPPRGWADCDGQLLPISSNQSLYSLLGTTYGGDGRTSFALPDLRGRAPQHFGEDGGPTYNLGQNGGGENVQLLIDQMPAHTHTVEFSTSPANTDTAEDNVPAKPIAPIYGSAQALVSMHADSFTTVGGNQAHNNMQPFLTLRFCIALTGLFPSRN